MDTQVLRIEKRINADATRLFRAWLNAEDFSQWFLPGIPVESATLDPRPGGQFRIDMLLNGKTLPHEGEYRVIEEPTRLVFTWRSHATQGRETLVTVTFTPLPQSDLQSGIAKPATLITLTHERLISEEEIKSHRGGWTSILDCLEKWM